MPDCTKLLECHPPLCGKDDGTACKFSGMAVAQLGGRGNGAIIAYDLATGDEKWRWAQKEPEYASPVVLTAHGIKQIVTLTEKSIVGVGLSDGKLLWRLPFVPQRRAYNAATPIVERQTVIYTGAGRGTKAVKIEKHGDGYAPKELWSNPDLAPQYNTPVLVDGLLFGLSDRGNLFASTRRRVKWSGPTQPRAIAAASVPSSTPARC